MTPFQRFEELWGTLLQEAIWLSSHPATYLVWGFLLVVGGVPALLLSRPVYRRARLYGWRSAARLAGVPLVVVYGLFSLNAVFPGDGRYAGESWAVLVVLLWVASAAFVTGVWMPVSAVMLSLGLRHRRADAEAALQPQS